MASAAFHVVLGASFLLSHKAGEPEQSAHVGRRGRALVVELLPLPEGDLLGTKAHQKDKPTDLPQHSLASAGAYTLPSRTGTTERIGKPVTGDTGTGTSELQSGGTNNDAGAPKLAGSEVQTFRASLQDHIRRFQRYPDQARLDGRQGVVRIQFVMDRHGGVAKAWVETSSGSTLLDEEAVAAIFRARPLPLPPESWPAAFGVTLPIQFSLQ